MMVGVARDASVVAFDALGESRVLARVLAVLVRGGSWTLEDLATHTKYSVHSVRNAVMEIHARGWLRSQEQVNDNRGRNPLAYTFKAHAKALEKHYMRSVKERVQKLLAAT